jgi:hypothetical protein
MSGKQYWNEITQNSEIGECVGFLLVRCLCREQAHAPPSRGATSRREKNPTFIVVASACARNKSQHVEDLMRDLMRNLHHHVPQNTQRLLGENFLEVNNRPKIPYYHGRQMLSAFNA